MTGEEPGSSVERTARSGTGANSAPAPVSGSGTMWTSRTSSLVARTSTSATPGMAFGGRTVTSTYTVRRWLPEHIRAADVRSVCGAMGVAQSNAA